LEKKVLHANLSSIKLALVLQNHKVVYAMEKKELSQQRPDGELRRLEYKSPTLRKLGNLTHMTLATMAGAMSADGMPGTDKTG
jgi:hypothetical protein